MKTLTTTIVGLSLLVGSALSAQDNFAAFYPAEDIDTPSYLVSNDKVEGHQSLAQSSIKDSTLTAFFPTEDVDTPEFLRNSGNTGQSAMSHAIAQSSLKGDALCAIYPTEDSDTASYLQNC